MRFPTHPPPRGRAAAAAASLALTLLGASAAHAQEEPVLLSVDADLADFGVERPGSVRHGRVALVHDPAGARLAVHFLRTQPPTAPPTYEPPVVPGPVRAVDDPAPEVRALWVWTTADILRDEAERAAFLDFVSSQSIGRVFLYVPAAEGERPEAGYVPFDGDALAPLLAELRARGALTYALDGDPDYVHPENHAGVLRTVRRVADHNRTHPPEERFYGVRYDIEPYLVPGFQGPRRHEILDHWVQLLAAVADLARGLDLRVGADIPFWLDAGDEVTGEAFEAELDGRRDLVLRHVMRTVDDVGIMAYRTRADGPNGVIPHSWSEIAFGNDGWAEVYVGVETTRIHDEVLYTLRGTPRSGLPPVADARWIVLEELDGTDARVWLVEGRDALEELARHADEERLTYWFAGQPVPLPGDLVSFRSLGVDAMRGVTGEIERRFRGQPAYLGLAFHDYRGLRALLSDH